MHELLLQKCRLLAISKKAHEEHCGHTESLDDAFPLGKLQWKHSHGHLWGPRGRSSLCCPSYRLASSSRWDWRTGCCSCSPAEGNKPSLTVLSMIMFERNSDAAEESCCLCAPLEVQAGFNIPVIKVMLLETDNRKQRFMPNQVFKSQPRINTYTQLSHNYFQITWHFVCLACASQTIWPLG